MDTKLPIDLPPGYRNTGTVYDSKGRWYTGNFVRFVGKTKQPIGGWTARSLTVNTNNIEGVPRGMHAWTPEVIGASQPPVIAVGSTGDIAGLTVISGTVKYDITPALITTQGNNDGRIWHLDNFGSYLVALAYDPSDYTKTKGPFVWTGDTASIATAIAGDAYMPTTPVNIVVTPERFFVVLGGFDYAGEFLLHGANVPSQRTVYWAKREGTTEFTPKATNNAGKFPLNTDGALLQGLRSRTNTILLTTTDAWTMTFIGGQFVFRFDQVGKKCGSISTRAGVVNDVGAFWMGRDGFYMFDGFVKKLECEVKDYVYDSINESYHHLIWALEVPAHNEVWWFYPHAAQTEITRAVVFNYRENTWVYHTLARTAGVSSQPGTHNGPVMANASGSIFNHETGTGRNSEGTPSCASGPIELDNGDNLLQIQSVLPDDKTVGDVNMKIHYKNAPDSSETTSSTFTLTARTTFRIKARQIRIELTEASASAWRVGTIRLGVIKSSRR